MEIYVANQYREAEANGIDFNAIDHVAKHRQFYIIPQVT